LANTATICRKYYVHPALVERHESGAFRDIFAHFSPRRKNGHTRDEQILARFLRGRK
jgi:DNA topoisomerase IB